MFSTRHPVSRCFIMLAGLVAVAAFVFFLASCIPTTSGNTEITLSEAIQLSITGNIGEADINTGGGVMTVTAAVSGSPISTTDAGGNPLQITNGMKLDTNIDNLNVADLQQLGFVLPPKYSTNAVSSGTGLGSTLAILLPILLIIGLIYIFFRSSRGMQTRGMDFARSRAREITGRMPQVTFSDVAGAEEAKEDLQEVVGFLKNRTRFERIGAKIPKGVLLTGPPGTGKTLLARAVAGEAGVPFFSVNGSEFVEVFVGVGAARVRDLFEKAKSNAPCIIFIDEIDAVGRLRSGGGPGTHEEREQTLNQILSSMDGFDPNMGVIVMAATNRADILDPALLRPGRFDRRVTLDLPDTKARRSILEIHAKGKVLEESVDLGVIAKETHGFSGADLADLANEAAILAVRRNKAKISMTDFEDAIDRIVAGPERRSLQIHPKDRNMVAYHESGHALVAHLLPSVDPVHKISIIARGSAGGYTRLLTEDRYFLTKSQLRENIATMLAGHAAEELVLGEVSTGPHNDLKQATEIARKMVTDYGMTEKLGLRTYGQESAPPYLGLGPPREKDYSEFVAKEIDDEIAEILENAHEMARKIIRENRARLEHIASRLLDKDTLEGEELEAVFTEPLTEEEKKLSPAPARVTNPARSKAPGAAEAVGSEAAEPA